MAAAAPDDISDFASSRLFIIYETDCAAGTASVLPSVHYGKNSVTRQVRFLLILTEISSFECDSISHDAVTWKLLPGSERERPAVPIPYFHFRYDDDISALSIS